MKRYYALVKWVGGEDDGTYSTDVPVKWIQGFNYDEFKKNPIDEDESYVIEWRNEKKQPLGGWQCYDGIVIKVSDKILNLVKELETINGVKSPRKVPNRNKVQPPHNEKIKACPFKNSSRIDLYKSSTKKLQKNKSITHPTSSTSKTGNAAESLQEINSPDPMIEKNLEEYHRNNFPSIENLRPSILSNNTTLADVKAGW